MSEDAAVGAALFSARAGALPEPLLESLLPDAWPRLFPLRVRHGDQIRGALARRSDVGDDARAAFGLKPPVEAPAWLYRDYYLDEAPAAPSIDAAVGALRRGDIRRFASQFRDASSGVLDWQFAWYHLCVLLGTIVGPLRITEGARVLDAPLEPFPQSAGPQWRSVREPRTLASEWSLALSQPMGVERHRANAVAALAALRSGQLAIDLADAVAALLRHHTELSVSLAQGRPMVTSATGADEEAAKLSYLVPILNDRASFAIHVWQGLASRSRARRFLCYGLLRLEGLVGADTHPDDASPMG